MYWFRRTKQTLTQCICFAEQNKQPHIYLILLTGTMVKNPKVVK